MSKQEEIKSGLKKLQMGKRPNPDGINLPSFLSPDDVDTIWAYLHSKDVVIKAGQGVWEARIGGTVLSEVEPLLEEEK